MDFDGSGTGSSNRERASEPAVMRFIGRQGQAFNDFTAGLRVEVGRWIAVVRCQCLFARSSCNARNGFVYTLATLDADDVVEANCFVDAHGWLSS